MKFLENNLKILRERILQCCTVAKRNPESVQLLAVTKVQPLEKLQGLYDLGLRSFGENRVQEMNDKAKILPNDIEWHLIGPLQSNKVRQALQSASVIHSVDSLKLLRRINNIAEEEGKKPKIFLQVNLSHEEQKSGFSCEELAEAVQIAVNYNSVKLIGLMTMGATSHSDAETSALFRELYDLRNQLQQNAPELTELSMGMSGDFPLAIAEGSTCIRVGSLLLGARDYGI